jgi:hypothetical protein
MENLIKQQGRTVLLVSHNIRQVERMCDRVLLMDHGVVKMDGKANAVCNAFYEQNDEIIVARQRTAGKRNILGTGEVELLDIYCADSNGKPTDTVTYGAAFNLVVKIKVHKPLVSPQFVVGIHTTDFVYITTTTSPPELQNTPLPMGIHQVSLNVDKFPLLPGAHSIRLSVDVEKPVKNILYGENLCHFTVVSEDLQRSASYCEGFFLMPSRWTLSGA